MEAQAISSMCKMLHNKWMIMEESEVKAYLEDGAKARLNLDYSLIYHIGREIGRQIVQGKKLLIFGNGG